jgi:hypothetical protein
MSCAVHLLGVGGHGRGSCVHGALRISLSCIAFGMSVVAGPGSAVSALCRDTTSSSPTKGCPGLSDPFFHAVMIARKNMVISMIGLD